MPAEVLFDAIGDGRSGAYQQVTKNSRAWTTGTRHELQRLLRDARFYDRGIDICHETVRYWWNRFGPMFAAAIRKRGLHHRSF